MSANEKLFGGDAFHEFHQIKPHLADPTPGTIEYERALQRDAGTRDLSALPWMPSVDAKISGEHAMLAGYERALIAPNRSLAEYGPGTATEDNEIYVYGADELKRKGGILFSAEHATSPGTRKDGGETYPDTGTAALSFQLAQEFGASVIATGRQTLPATDPTHPIKQRIAELLPAAQGFISVHGKAPGAFIRPTDESEVHAMIGLGANPTELQLDTAADIRNRARKQLGLLVVTSNIQPCYIQVPGATGIKRIDKDGELVAKTSALAALSEGTTTNFARRELANAGRHDVVALQVELANSMRLTSLDGDVKKTPETEVVGAFMGLQLMRLIARTVNEVQ